ncbi:DMT family transporter [Yoonia sp. MH D7]
MTLLSRQGHLAMLLFSVLVAGSFALGAMAANEITPMALNAVRFWIATVVIGVVVVARGGVPREAFAASWRYLILAAIFAIYFVLMFEGLKTAPAVSAAAVYTLTPILAAGFGWLILRQTLTGRMASALLIGGIGALWVIFRADINALMRFELGRGEAVYFLGCVCHALYTPLVRKLNRGETALIFAFGTVLGAAVLLTIAGWSDLMATQWTGLPAVVWVTILYTAVFATAATSILLQFSAMRLPASKAMAYTYLVPAWVIIWDIALGGAAPPVAVIAGIGLTAVALVLLLRD